VIFVWSMSAVIREGFKPSPDHRRGPLLGNHRNKAIYLLIQMLIDPSAKLLLLMAAIQIAGNNEFVIN